MKKNTWFYYILLFLVIGLLRFIDISKIPPVVIVVFSILGIWLFLTITVKYKHENKYLNLLMLILALTTLTLGGYTIIEDVYPKFIDDYRIYIALLMVVEMISVIVIGLIAIEKKNKS